MLKCAISVTSEIPPISLIDLMITMEALALQLLSLLRL